MNRLTLLTLTLAATALAATSSTAHAQATAIDAWGRYINVVELDYRMDAKQMIYAPKGRFYFVVEGAESDDIALASWKKDGKALADTKCPIQIVDKLAGTSQSVVVADCKLGLEAHGQKAAGRFSVTLGYRQVSAGQEHAKLVDYTFAVVQHVGPAKQVEFHVDHDFRMGEAWLHQKGDGGVEIFSWFKVGNEDTTHVHKGKMRCKVGGVDVPIHEITNSRAEHSFDDYANVTDGSPAKTSWNYHYFFISGDARGFVNSNPGEYRCTYVRNGELDRELTFTIADGKAVKPACQAGDAPVVRAPPSTTFIKQVFKTPQDRSFDAKAFGANALFGRSGVGAACGF